MVSDVVETTQPGLWAELQVLVRHPSPGLQSPQMEKPVTSQIVHNVVKQGQRGFYYVLSEDWEVVPGTWVFEFYSQGKKIAEQAFELIVDGKTTSTS